MDGRPTWTDCDEAGDYVVPNVLSPRDLVSKPDNMDETVPHMNMRYLGVPTSMPSNNVVCLLTFTSYRHDVKGGVLALPKPPLRLI